MRLALIDKCKCRHQFVFETWHFTADVADNDADIIQIEYLDQCDIFELYLPAFECQDKFKLKKTPFTELSVLYLQCGALVNMRLSQSVTAPD